MPKESTPLRTSERTAYKRCRQKWWWTYQDHLRPKKAATALRFGTLVHAAMEVRYPVGKKRGPHPAETFVTLFDREVADNGAMLFRTEALGEWESARDVGVQMLEAFVDEFGDDDQYEVVSSEQFFSRPVRNKIARFRYVGTIDGVWRDLARDGRLVLVDWKTAASIRTNHLALDDQAAAYLAFGVPALRASGILRPNDECNQIAYTFMRKAEPDRRPRNGAGLYLNKDGSVSKSQPPALFQRVNVFKSAIELREARRRASHEFAEMKLVRDGDLYVTKTTGAMTCGMCEFRDMCEVHEAGGDWKLYADTMYDRWDPYSQTEVENDERR